MGKSGGKRGVLNTFAFKRSCMGRSAIHGGPHDLMFTLWFEVVEDFTMETKH